MVRSFSIASQSYSICTVGRSKRIVNSAAAVRPEIAVAAAAAEDAAGDAAENAAEDAASAVYLVTAAYSAAVVYATAAVYAAAM